MAALSRVLLRNLGVAGHCRPSSSAVAPKFQEIVRIRDELVRGNEYVVFFGEKKKRPEATPIST